MLIGIITDIHEDAERLQTAIAALEKRNCDKLICLGDISGFDRRYYSYDFSKNLRYCLDILKSNCWKIIPGNHDLFNLKKLPQYNNIFHFPDNWYDLSFAEKKAISNDLVWLYESDTPIDEKENLFSLLSNCTNYFSFNENNITFHFSHSVYPDISGFSKMEITDAKNYKMHLDYLKQNNADIGICGHFHPNGILTINQNKITTDAFNQVSFSNKSGLQFVCPCIAEGYQDNGYTILDTTNSFIQAIPLRTPSSKFLFL